MILVTNPMPEDAKAIQHVLYTTWIDTYPNEDLGITVDDIQAQFGEPFSEAVLERIRNNINTPPPHEALLVAKEDNSVIGLCRIKMHENKNQLQAIYVLPTHQRQGAGKLLWQKALEVIDTRKLMIVHVATYNKNAIAFYKGLGFTETRNLSHEECFTLKSGVVIPEMELQWRLQ